MPLAWLSNWPSESIRELSLKYQEKTSLCRLFQPARRNTGGRLLRVVRGPTPPERAGGERSQRLEGLQEVNAARLPLAYFSGSAAQRILSSDMFSVRRFLTSNATFAGVLCLLAVGPGAVGVRAQLLTAASQADLYIAHIADGGPTANRWTTQFRFVNSGIMTGGAANGVLYFYADDGSPLSVDFGSGPSSTFTISIPPGGSTRAETLGSGQTLREGFVRMVFDSPVQVSAEFRNWLNGAFSNGASVNGTTPAFDYWYFADTNTGIAIANQNNFPVTCSGSFADPSGNTVASTKSIAIGPLNHTAFTVGGLLSLAPTAVGSFQLACSDSSGNPASVVSLGIAGTGGQITSSLPNSSGSIPVRHWEDIEKAFAYVVKMIQTSSYLSQYSALLGQPHLVIATDNTTINACAERPQSVGICNGPVGTVKIWLSLAELLADSPSEMAFAVAHELGHVVQMNKGNQNSLQMIFPVSSVNQTVETDADLFAFTVCLTAGYDPYAAGGTLGKLMMITGSATINAQYEQDVQAVLGTDMHTSTLNRLNNLYNTIQIACQSNSLCQTYKNYFHPNFPVSTPLTMPGTDK